MKKTHLTKSLAIAFVAMLLALAVAPATAFASDGTWVKDGSHWKYRDSNDVYVADMVKKIDGVWYGFDSHSYMQTGWFKWYLPGPGSGYYWYYFGKSGAAAVGWREIDGTWYYFDPDTAAMVSGCMREIKGKWYCFKSSGAMVTGWRGEPYSAIDINGNPVTATEWYYFTNSGAAAEGWRKVDGTWYYFSTEGIPFMYADCTKEINGQLYGFKKSGAMAEGWFSASWNSDWYFASSSGAFIKGWMLDGNTWYWFEPTCLMHTGWAVLNGKTYFFKPSGAMVTGWWQDATNWYYFDKSGAMVTNRWVGDYYLGEYGEMLTDTHTPDGYYVNAYGQWDHNPPIAP
ncbi:MAG: hypothetical protein Q4D48_06675 [Coriobacteriales bacterium]|nr:hypothetical protein [Coriobacteriales bacterium]